MEQAGLPLERSGPCGQRSALPVAACRLLAAAGGAAALWLRAILWPITSPDVDEFLLPWYRHILDRGPLGAFAAPFSNYTPPYLYLLAAASLFDGWLSAVTLIKLVAVAGTLFLALSVHSLLAAAGAPWRRTAAAAVFLLPSAAINAAALAQCDAYWTAACLFAVAEAVRGRTTRMLVWCGVALAFNAQAAFLAPFILALLIARRVPLGRWLIPPAVYAAAMLPAWLAGWPMLDLLLVYPRQAGQFVMAGNLANPWIGLDTLLGPDAVALFPIGYAAALAAGAAFVAIFSRRRWSPAGLIAGALLCALMLPWLPPKMHERFFFLADLLAFSLALVARDRASLAIALAVQLASLSAYFSYYVDWPFPAIVGSLLPALAILAVLRFLQRDRPSTDGGAARHASEAPALTAGRPATPAGGSRECRPAPRGGSG